MKNVIISFDLVEKPKPEPDIYQKIIDIANLEKDETIIIEDSATGIQAGVAAGYKGYWFNSRRTLVRRSFK